MASSTPRRRRTDRVAQPWLTPGRLLSLIAVLVGSYATLVMVRALRGILVMLLVALFLSFAMEPAVQFLSRRGWRRGAATAGVFLLVTLFSLGAVASMIPLVATQVQGLINSVPQTIDELNSQLQALPIDLSLETSDELRQDVERFGALADQRFQDVAFGAASNVVDVSATALGVLFQLATIALVTFYLVADGPRARAALARPFPPGRQRELLAIWELAVAKTGGYFYSRILLAGVCAGATALVLLVIGVPYPLPLALWVGITNAFVPLVGTYLGGLLVLLVAFVENPVSTWWVLGFLIVYQQVENYLLAPRIQARTMDVHPAVAFISVLVGGTLLGAVGALLALPATAIIQALLQTYVRRHDLIDELRGVTLPSGVTVPSETYQLKLGEEPEGDGAARREPGPSKPAASQRSAPA
ncbi:MAG: AI-2E family transporter [Egibacteraceae bacterium]